MASRKIDDLAADIKPLALAFITECKLAGIDVLIYCTYRNAEEQNELYKSGRSKPGKIKTKARGGESPHNLLINGKPSSRAFDCVPIINGHLSWEKSGASGIAWRKMGKIGKILGLNWGGTWKGGFVDWPHFELK